MTWGKVEDSGAWGFIPQNYAQVIIEVEVQDALRYFIFFKNVYFCILSNFM